jgi:hypothetical protein
MQTQFRVADDSRDDEAFKRAFTILEEDRHQYTSARWSGGYRWFRLPNVMCIVVVGVAA